MRIVVQTGFERSDDGTRNIPIVEIWIGGRRFIHRCTTPEEARKFALATIFDLGIGDGQ